MVPNALPILIVEDDGPTQTLLQALLRRGGFDTEVARNGLEGIERLQAHQYAAVVLDLMMPGVGGKDVIDYLSTAPDKVPVVICSAAGPAALTGFDPSLVKAIVRKPFDVDQFIAAVTAAAAGLEHVAQPAGRVLIVDDDPGARYTLRAFLELPDIAEAESGEEALEMIRQSPPDLVLLDLALPGTQGEEILRQLASQEQTRALPVVVVTSRKLDFAERSALLEHAVAVIYKGDLSRDTLRDAVAAALQRMR